MKLGIGMILFVILVMMLHEELQRWLSVGHRWWRRRYRPTRWTSQTQWQLARFMQRVK